MKKFFALFMVAILVVVLVACGGGETTTQKPDTTTEPKTNETTPKAPVTEDPTPGTTEPKTPDTDPPAVDDEPLFAEGVDIMNGDFENQAVNPFWNQGSWPCAFEDQHPALEFNWALVFVMFQTENGIYEQLVFTDPDTEEGYINDDYKWIVVIDNVEYEIERFSFINNKDNGYIRMDLGADFELNEEDPHDYDCVLKIYDREAETLEFWAWFTDPDLCGLYTFEKPAPVVMIDDPNRPENHVALPAGSLTGISGAAGFNAEETYVNLFDNQVRSKLCTNDVTTPIEFMIKDGPKTIVSYSLVGANDDVSYSSRVVTNFKLLGSNDGQAWTQIDVRNFDPSTVTIANYGELNYQLETPVTYQYFRLEITHATDMYQISEIVLYTEAE